MIKVYRLKFDCPAWLRRNNTYTVVPIALSSVIVLYLYRIKYITKTSKNCCRQLSNKMECF